MGSEHQLLDVTDRTLRLLQHGSVLAGIAVLVLAGTTANRPGGHALALWMIAAGLGLFGAAAVTRQKWSVRYKGHEIRFENNPFLGEKLFIDKTLAAGRGKLGFRSETRGVIAAGDGIGDTVIARTDAGFLTFRCRITVEPAETADAIPSAVSDEQLLAELRRRGLADRS